MTAETPTRIRADFSERAVAHTDAMEWVDSPASGVERKMLDRVGDEVARATSLVRYAPRSSFPPHEHGGGEEFLVLEGVFSDERGDYPAGTYVRNPIGSRHAPSSEPGCTILVKLRQMHDPDEPRTVVATRGARWTESDTGSVARLELFAHGETGERVCVERWTPGVDLGATRCEGGAEYFVLEGGFGDEEGEYRRGSWLRLPAGATHHPVADAEGCTVWIKRGHLEPDTIRAEGLDG
jgi:anti-sigma factor ChrR (cupin superfamily)